MSNSPASVYQLPLVTRSPVVSRAHLDARQTPNTKAEVGLKFVQPDTSESARALFEETKKAFRRHRPGGKKVSEDDLLRTWTAVTTQLQGSQLCINFDAVDFFDCRNQSEFIRLPAALHFGGQLHGPRPRAGMSYLVLRDCYKFEARYFVRDAVLKTYYAATKGSVDYETLGSIYGLASKCNEGLRQALDETCFHLQTLPDDLTENASYTIIEARLAAAVPFDGGIKAIHLSRLVPRASERGPLCVSLTDQQWIHVRQNAERFAHEHGSQLVITSN